MALAAWSTSSSAFVVPSGLLAARATWTGRPAAGTSAPMAVSVDKPSWGGVRWLCYWWAAAFHCEGGFGYSVANSCVLLVTDDAARTWKFAWEIRDEPCCALLGVNGIIAGAVRNEY